MPKYYGGKRKRYPRGSRSRKIARKRKSVYALSKKVDYLAKRQRQITVRAQYTVSWDENISANYSAHPLVVPQSWQSVFGESENVVEAQKIFIKKLNLDWQLSPAKEQDQIDYTVFLISARNNKVFSETLGLTSFQNNPNGQQDYTDVPITFMNPKRFKIHKVWRCQTSGIRTKVLGNLANEVNINNTNHYARRYFKMPWKRKIQTTANQESWKQIDDDEIPIHASLALIAFNNNSAIDIENPNWKGCALFSCYL